MVEAHGAFSDVRGACRAHTAVPSTLRCAYATTSKALLCDTAVYALGLLVRGCLIVSYSKVHAHAVGPLKRAIKALNTRDRPARSLQRCSEAPKTPLAGSSGAMPSCQRAVAVRLKSRSVGACHQF